MKDRLLALPQDEDVWIAAAQLLRIPAKAGKGEQAVWLLVIQSRAHHFVLGTHVHGEQPGPQALLSALVEAMLEPRQGAARRPAAIEEGPNLSWDPVVPMLEQIGIAVRPAGSLDDLNTVFQYLSIQMSGRKLPDLPIAAVDERTQDTIAKRDELRGLLGGRDADRLVQAARSAMAALEARVKDPTLGLPPVDRGLLLEVHELMLRAVERAAQLGSDEAALWLGDIRYEAEDMDGALALFEQRAKAGHPLGAAKAAELIRRLERADRYADALRWLDAALARDPNGMVHYIRGLYAFNGLGCPADRVAAFGLHEEAAARGNADAMFELYAMLTQGVGCAADPARAVGWCVRAAEGGNVRAMANLGGLYAAGNGLPQDRARSVEWYARAAEKGHGRAAASLGCMYALGQEIEPDEHKARWYFARAQELGYDWRPMAAMMGLQVAEWESMDPG